MKINATKLLLEHTGDTFVTPVFNGSASLRDAAGQLIENVVKSVKRKEKVDDTYIEKLYSDVTSLYRLGQGTESAFGKKELGKLPVMSVILLTGLGAVWVLILVYVLWNGMKRRLKIK